jgi:hypothetical protein
MTHEQKVRAVLALRYAAWFRVCRIMEARLGRPLDGDDCPSPADITAARAGGPLADEASRLAEDAAFWEDACEPPGWREAAETAVAEYDAYLRASSA